MRSALDATCSTDSSPLAYKTPPPENRASTSSMDSSPASDSSLVFVAFFTFFAVSVASFPRSPANCNKIVLFPTPGSPPTNTKPPGTTPPPKTRSISEPNVPGKGTRRIFFEFFDSGFNTSFNARGAFESETHPPLTVLFLLLFLLKIKDEDDFSSLSVLFDCARCAAAAPAPPPDFPLFDPPFAFEIGSRKTFMESHALHPGHWPYHCE
mmetsp:Transcript_2998/g.10728  ORF Transcript_2998/g.10728 Transcript_2998/m.10728 type:complete len:210 (-) Transcript_2998:352-981(-)